MTLTTKLMASAGFLALSTGLAAAAPAVVQSAVNLRSGPGTDYPVITAMPAGAPVDVAGCGGFWCRVNFDGTVGFASRGFLGLGAAGAGYGPGYAYGGSYGGYESGYASGGYYGGYEPGYRYGYQRYGAAYSSGGGQEFRGERSARGQQREQGQQAEQIKGNNPMKDYKSSSNPNLPKTQGQAAQIRGNNPMKDYKSTSNPNLSRTQGQAAQIRGNNPMKDYKATTTGAAPREKSTESQ